MPDEPKATARTSSSSGYSSYEWHGMKRWKCDSCPVNTDDEEAMKEHQRTATAVHPAG